MIAELKNELEELYPAGTMLRQAHPKMHGLVSAEFEVLPNLPDNLKIGVFQKQARYQAWIRFSNSNAQPQADSKGDIRGMAIKLMGVEGEKLLSESAHASTQDFVLISHETFLARNVKQFSRTIKAITSGSKLQMLLFALNPLNWGVLFRSVRAFNKPGSVLDIPYYSATPYQFGSLERAVKYLCLPVNPVNFSIPENADADFLKYNMVKQLAESEKQFDFFVQFQENANSMPIEDPTIAWKSKPVKVATLRIPVQNFDTDENKTLGENLSFSPWHSLTEHRPLGGFNRARRWVYAALSEFRHQHNQVPMSEPEPTKSNPSANE